MPIEVMQQGHPSKFLCLLCSNEAQFMTHCGSRMSTTSIVENKNSINIGMIAYSVCTTIKSEKLL